MSVYLWAAHRAEQGQGGVEKIALASVWGDGTGLFRLEASDLNFGLTVNYWDAGHVESSIYGQSGSTGHTSTPLFVQIGGTHVGVQMSPSFIA